MRIVLVILLIGAYLFALIMSTGHLAEWYRLTLGPLPLWFATGLAAALEMSAFLLSLLSNSILKSSRWASWGGLVALGLVWAGNLFSMLRAGPDLPVYEVFLSSLFVPVSTYVVVKVLGELLGGNPVPAPASAAIPTPPPAPVPAPPPEPVSPVPPPQPARLPTPTPGRSSERYLVLLETPRSPRELMQELGVSKAAVYKTLKSLEDRGLVARCEDGLWVVKKLEQS